MHSYQSTLLRSIQVSVYRSSWWLLYHLLKDWMLSTNQWIICCPFYSIARKGRGCRRIWVSLQHDMNEKIIMSLPGINLYFTNSGPVILKISSLQFRFAGNFIMKPSLQNFLYSMLKKFCSDTVAWNGIIVEFIFHRIRIGSENSLLKWLPPLVWHCKHS